MMDKHIANYIEIALNECLEITGEQPSEKYLALYEAYPSDRAQLLFSAIHVALNDSLKHLNSCLPTRENEGYFWAEPSRTLIALIQLCRDVQESLRGSELSCTIDDHYAHIMHVCSGFLSQSGGSNIPQHTDRFSLYYTQPVFILDDTVAIPAGGRYQRYQLKLIGEGSYAKVFRYRDSFYGTQFVVKRAKPNLSDKELARFRQEYDVMHRLCSPYVVEVYRFDDGAHEYIMECMDCTLEDYLKSSGNRLGINERKRLALQFLRGMSYLHSRNMLHRDISPRNVLLRKYDDVVVLKLSDFGLVKVEESMLTSSNTAFKGSFNDPALQSKGFASYGMEHEVYAMTRMLYFILTGRKNAGGESSAALKEFLKGGTCEDASKRYKGAVELREALLETIKEYAG
ncbi:MAG: protein kinase [Atopobiaceae bacterium]|nr:protein kinase [Atopobiaceae bacterium]